MTDRERKEGVEVSSDKWNGSVECCGNCAFWPLVGYQHSWQGAPPYGCSGPGSDGSLSDCRRRAPIGINLGRYPSKTAEWPSTARDDYCGEFELRG